MPTEPKQASHTPGNWIAASYGRDIQITCFGQQIAVLNLSSDSDRKTQEANARLIAAAPDLLSLCQEVYTKALDFQIHVGKDLGDRLRTAIARAEGGAA